MSEKKWYYTDSLAEASSLLRNKKILPHGGGTHLNNIDLSHVEGLLDLSHLGLNFIKQNGDTIEIGAMATYADVVEKLKEISCQCLLLQTLKDSANNNLRNRITIGGSIAYIPQWSDLIGALLALDATVKVMGKNEGEYDIATFWRDHNLRKNSLITSVRFKNFPHKYYHYRDVKTNNDMPLFTISTLFDMDQDKIKNTHVLIVGTKKRVSKLTELENYLTGKKLQNLNETEVKALVNVDFAGKRVVDSDYLKQKAKIETWRSIFKAMEQ
jgi:CO/xanthine dehydrogenase FAD-binding subunit